MMMATGGRSPPNIDSDPVLEKVKVLVGPVIDGMINIYDGDSDIMESQNKPPLDASILETELIVNPKTNTWIKMEEDDKTPHNKKYFTNDRVNLKRKPHCLLSNKNKLNFETLTKQAVSHKFRKLSDDKYELRQLQHQLLTTQLEDAKETLEHNRRLRAMEVEEVKKKYEHNEKIRKFELERFVVENS